MDFVNFFSIPFYTPINYRVARIERTRIRSAGHWDT